MDGMKKDLILFESVSFMIRFFTYGSFPLSDTLAFLNDYLNHYKKSKTGVILSAFTEESRWNQPRSVNINCSPQSFVVDPNRTTTVGVSYLLGR